MGKLLTFVLGFGVLLYVGFRYLEGRANTDGPEAEPPAAALEKVRSKADDIEEQGRKRAEEAAREP